LKNLQQPIHVVTPALKFHKKLGNMESIHKGMINQDRYRYS